MRLLLGQSGRRRHLCQRHAGELARLRSCRDRFGRAEAHRYRLRRRRSALDLDRGGARRGQDRSVRHRPAHARRQDHAGAALSQARLRRRRLAGFVAHARDQPRARRAFRSRTRRRSPLHALLRPYADGDCDGGPRRRGGARQCPLRQARAEPQPGRRGEQVDLPHRERARSQPSDRGDQPGGGRAGRHRPGRGHARRRQGALGAVLRHRGRGGRARHRSRHRLSAGDHRAAHAGKPDQPVAEDGHGRPARRRHRARLQQRAVGHHDGQRLPAERAQADRSVVPGHHADQAERDPRRDAGAATARVLAPPDAAAAGARPRRRACPISPCCCGA